MTFRDEENAALRARISELEELLFRREEAADLIAHAMFKKVYEAEERMRKLAEHLRKDPYDDNEGHSLRVVE